jgi:hypothetical protein
MPIGNKRFVRPKAVHAKVRLVYVSLGVLLSANVVLLSGNKIIFYFWSSYVFGVLLLLGFYCRVFIHFQKYLKNWGSNVVGVLLSLEFYCQHPTVLFFFLFLLCRDYCLLPKSSTISIMASDSIN